MSDFVVGLTGGIGSGKSTVAERFGELGVALVDTDAIAHRLTAPAGFAMPALQAAFGQQIVAPDGALDRQVMRRLVFSDPAARARLESILHPLIRQFADEDCRAAPTPYVVLAVPLLVESASYRERCDRILVVDCPEALQIERVMARNGLREDEVRAIMAAQATRAARLAAADDVVANEASRAALGERIGELHAQYLRLSAEKVHANG